MPANKPVPPTWAEDDLTQAFDALRRNQFATFVRKPVAKELIFLDSLMTRCFDGGVDIVPVLPVGFFLRAHSAFRAGCASAMGGQVVEAFALLRLCIEHVAYGVYIADDQSRQMAWLQRSDSQETRAKVRREFQAKRVSAHLAERSADLGRVYQHLYERCIDFGAHPNEQGYFANAGFVREESGSRFETVFLQGDGLQLDLTLKTAAQCGILVLRAALLIYPERLKRQEIDEHLTRLMAWY